MPAASAPSHVAFGQGSAHNPPVVLCSTFELVVELEDCFGNACRSLAVRQSEGASCRATCASRQTTCDSTMTCSCADVLAAAHAPYAVVRRRSRATVEAHRVCYQMPSEDSSSDFRPHPWSYTTTLTDDSPAITR